MNHIIVSIGNSIIQHGKFNDRIYLIKLSKEDFPDIIEELDRIALREGYSKIFAKVPIFAKDKFIDNDYIIEARIPKFYNGKDNVYFMGKYFSESRMFDSRIEEMDDILDDVLNIDQDSTRPQQYGSRRKPTGTTDTVCDAVQRKPNTVHKKIYKNIKFDLPYGFDYRICDKSNIYQIADVYKKVFNTYPFPIYDPEYIARTMDENFIYFSIQKNGEIVAMSSCEMDIDSQNVEMTDFATLPEYQGNGFALYLLHNMEDEMKKRNIKVAYTISRAMSYGANIIFAKMGYKYCGTLYNNTNISIDIPIDMSIDKVTSGNFESMNVWYKYL